LHYPGQLRKVHPATASGHDQKAERGSPLGTLSDWQPSNQMNGIQEGARGVR
jgi:hypothetical protein